MWLVGSRAGPGDLSLVSPASVPWLTDNQQGQTSAAPSGEIQYKSQPLSAKEAPLCQGRGFIPALAKVSAPEINFSAPAQPQARSNRTLIESCPQNRTYWISGSQTTLPVCSLPRSRRLQFRCHPGTGYTGTALSTGQGTRASMLGIAQLITNVTGLKQALLPALSSVYARPPPRPSPAHCSPPLPSPAHPYLPTAPTTMACVCSLPHCL